MLPYSKSIEAIGDTVGKAVVNYQGIILATDYMVADLVHALTDPDVPGEEREKIEGLIRLMAAPREVDHTNDSRELEGARTVGSIVRCIAGCNESSLILWRGRSAEQLAHRIGRACKGSLVMCLPTPPASIVNEKVRQYRASAGFPWTPLWLNDGSGEACACHRAELRDAVLGRRIIVLIAEDTAYWEIDTLLAETGSQGTPVLPVTFHGARAEIGPLVLGGNASAFYSSRTEPRVYSSNETLDAARLLSASQEYSGAAPNIIVREVLDIIENLPDLACMSVREVGQDSDVNTKVVSPRQCLLDRRLQGTLWSIKSVLAPNVASDSEAWDRAARHLQEGGVVSIDSAFRKDITGIMHNSLSSSNRWRQYQDIYPYFFFQHHNIYNTEDMSPAMLVVGMTFSSHDTVEWASELVGSNCRGYVQQSHSWYKPGDHSTPHSDATSGRKLAFVWHLADAWEATWGGHLVWMGGDRILPATFNTLHLFDTRKSGRHFVMAVAPTVKGRRLCWNGWWTGPEDERDKSMRTEPSDPATRSGPFEFHQAARPNEVGSR